MLTLTVEEGSKCQEKHEASRNWKAKSNEYLPGDFSSNRSPKITIYAVWACFRVLIFTTLVFFLRITFVMDCYDSSWKLRQESMSRPI